MGRNVPGAAGGVAGAGGVWRWREQLPALRVKASAFVNAKDSKPVG